ncbi:MAG TPA: NADP-dependent oxidoreductase [Actinomycetota bacterium]|jgi:NADPH2:quinone reductase|nr:NADP-dependent oxidoreductase [Actinomycetota bacterium]
MRAVVIERFGGPEVMQVRDRPDPDAGAGEVRISVYAAGTNPVDASDRSDGSWAGIDLPHVPGYDVAGLVDQVGEGVDGISVGQRVMAMMPFPRGAGGYAEFVVLPADLVAPLPAGVSFIDGAAVPLAAGTAYEVLERIDLAPGSWVLVHGASGGVGTFLVQLAATRDLHVIAASSARSHDLLRELGAADCIDYRDVDVAEAARGIAGGPVEAIVDLVGGTALQQSLGAVRSHGQLASIATPDLDLDPILDENLTFHGVLIEDSGERVRTLAGLLRAGTIRPILAEVFPLERVADAHRFLETGHSGGKIVLQVRSEGVA